MTFSPSFNSVSILEPTRSEERWSRDAARTRLISRVNSLGLFCSSVRSSFIAFLIAAQVAWHRFNRLGIEGGEGRAKASRWWFGLLRERQLHALCLHIIFNQETKKVYTVMTDKGEDETAGNDNFKILLTLLRRAERSIRRERGKEEERVERC